MADADQRDGSSAMEGEDGPRRNPAGSDREAVRPETDTVTDSGLEGGVDEPNEGLEALDADPDEHDEHDEHDEQRT